MSSLARVFSAFLLVLAFSISAAAQTTVVSATVVDPNGIPYAGAQVDAVLVLPAGGGATGQPVVTVNNAQQCISAGQGSAPCKLPFPGTVGPTTLDNTGSFTMVLQDNAQVTPAGTQWFFTVQTQGVPLPVGAGPVSFTSQITITGASQSITATLAPLTPLLTKSVSNISALNTNFSITGFGNSQFSIGSSLNTPTINLFGGVIRLGSLTNYHITQTAANTDTAGVLTCAAGTVTKNFATNFTSTPVIIPTDETTAGGARVSAKSNASFTITCTGATDVVDYLVIGNPN